jgi:apolipoprotein N-acyltransferase
MPFLFSWVVSLLIVSFGQSSLVPCLNIVSSSLGFAFFWYIHFSFFQNRKFLFWSSSFWFACVQAIQLYWLTSTQYMGPLILVVYVVLVSLIGLQFGCLVFFLPFARLVPGCLAIAGCWVLLEWMRLFFFSGFTWNPIGLSLAESDLSIQFASLFGVYGLSFWVIFINALALYVLQSGKRIGLWVALALFPYLYGFCQQEWVKRNSVLEQTLSVALVQTAILPEEKDFFPERKSSYIHPLHQWARIWDCLEGARSIDLIVLPEAAVALGARYPIYSLESVARLWKGYFGEGSDRSFPPLESPYAFFQEGKKGGEWKVTNSFIAQAMVNHFDSKMIIGLDDRDEMAKYNAAFYFASGGEESHRYEKRVLVPIGEYIPLSFVGFVSRFLSDQFGIGDCFDVGGDPKLFGSVCPIGVSICLEETYSSLIRDLRLKGARLFVNVSNDVWFPSSRLPKYHFQHGRIRAAENGVPVLRACNTGITGAVDCCGRVISSLPPSEDVADVLYVDLPLRSFHTFYTFWGDWAILGISLFFVLWVLGKRLLV